MSKKSFAGGLDSLLNSSIEKEPKNKSPQNVSPKKDIPNTKKKSLELEERYTFFAKRTSIKKIQALAWWERRSIKDIANEALDAYFEKKGSKHISHALDAFTKSKD
ncbi:MAG: hypothetical protein S4CHLAM123_10710 [Chlamydiales bacterium]|nr:hypothetical protein [Chlamydiales bacterium]